MTHIELQTLAEHRVAAVWAKFCKYYGTRLNQSMPVVSLNNRLKTTAGRSFYEIRKIDLSTTLFSEHTHNFLTDTIPHEVCHQVAWDIYKEKGHGPDWKHTMRVFGIEPSRCHYMTNTVWESQKADRR